ncbi:MAG TPA: hypothetical protein VFJ08_00090, partial [Salinisphaera sp.]|nr:hypothetical protein [Salinisphaera sp.]
MKMDRGSKNRLVGGLIVALLGILGAIYLGAGARRAALDGAIGEVSAAMTPMRAGSDLQQVAHRLVTASSSDLVFVTVRGADRRVLASAGAWSGWLDGLVPQSIARTWRAWLYRTLCVETSRPIAGGAQAHVGVPWSKVFVLAGPAFWLTVLLSVFGGIVAERERRARKTIAADEPAVSSPRSTKRRAESVGGRDARQSNPAGARDGVPGPRRGEAGSPGAPGAPFQPIGDRDRSRSTKPPKPAPMQDGEARPAPAPTAPPDRRTQQAPAPAAPTVNEKPEDERPVIDKEVDREVETDAEPETDGPLPFGQLLPRFQPIWRGATDGLLAGGIVRLVRGDDAAGHPVALEEFIATDARRREDPEEIVWWLVRRLTTLQANWRTLELPRVPLMLALPDALFAFERADAVWAEALTRYAPAPGDMVFCVDRLPAIAARAALPVRWAVVERVEDANWYRLQSATDENEPPSVETAAARDGLETCFVLPSADDAASRIKHPVLSPGAFARLM